MIPKTIHYCWFGGNELSADEKKCLESWKKVCPDYEIKRWDENNFDVNFNTYVKEAYERKKWAFVSDVARFYILYNEGGLYFDTDVELIKSIDDIVARGAFLGFERGGGVAPGLGMGAEQGMPLYREILEYYNGIHFINADGTQNSDTVVNIVSRILMKYGLKKPYRSQRVANIYIYSDEYFCPMDYRTGKTKITEKTRSIHHYKASWFTESEKSIQKIQRGLSSVFGETIGVKLGRVAGSFYRFFERLKTIGIKRTWNYYAKLFKRKK